MVSGDEFLDLFEGLEVLKDAVLENGVEFVLDTCQQCCLLVDIETKVIEALGPVELGEIEQFEVVDDLGHPSLHLGLI